MRQGKWLHWHACAMAVMSALGAGSSNGQFIGIELREDKSPADAEGLPGFPGADSIRVFNMYAMYAAESTNVTYGVSNVVLGLSQEYPWPGYHEQSGFGINVNRNPNATFYRSPPIAGGSTVGAYDVKTPGDARREWNTYFSLGLKPFNSKTGLFPFDLTAGHDDFGLFTNEKLWGERDLDHLPPLQRSDSVSGSLSVSFGDPPQSGARDLGDGSFGVFLAQFSVMNMDADAELGFGETAINPNQPFSTTATWVGDVFHGRFQLLSTNHIGYTEWHDIRFEVPSPGALALFAFAGAHFARRRR